ncbi:MAG: hypothetical protein GJ680_12255 [Alteromonadaceae bacterium]|nr:hypothetical protein [Alteromonadaceae bacterium]
MNLEQVIALLEQHQNPRGIEHWQKMNNTGGLSSYGIGLTQQRKLAKQVGKNRELAAQLWQQPNYDAKVLGLLIDNPKQITIEQAEQQVEQLAGGMLCHVFSSCDATLAKSPIAFQVAENWLSSEDPIRRRCAYGLVYELSKKKSKFYDDSFFMSVINLIDSTFVNQSRPVLLAMGGALLGIGKRSAELNIASVALAKKIGSIDFNEDGQTCDPFDVLKHLTNDRLKEKLGIS